ncbi:MAG: hypothetical protein IIB46_01045 [Nitrospinae bacterium]|nr:hypothetical protein [Nitrospinota bacterium]
MKKNNLIKIVICLVGMACYALVFIENESTSDLLGEDNLIENLGAFFFLIASLLYFLSFWWSSGSGKETNHLHPKRNIFYLLLAVIFFTGFGEEISWGQRIFGWEAPPFIKEINRQKETNIHNLKIFNMKQPDKEYMAVLYLLLNVQTWFFLFWFSYCLILPLINQYSLRGNRFISRFGLPLPPLWIGILLLANFLIYTIPHFTWWIANINHSLGEISEGNGAPIFSYFNSFKSIFFKHMSEVRESNEAFIFAVLSFCELKKQLSKKRGG